jgi:NADPH:quinone reductase-like Zn-dependent oxidoreductase
MAKADGLEALAVARPSDKELVGGLGADVVVEPADNVGGQIRSQLPSGAPGLIDGAALDALALPGVADGGGLVTLKGWAGPTERGIVIHPVSSFGSATDTALFDRLRSQVEEGILTLRVADVLPARDAAEAHRRLAAGGIRGRLVLDFTQPL